MIKKLKFHRDYRLIRRSGLFDDNYYLLNNPDVRRADVNPLMHFVKFGWKEGRNPSEYFDTDYYLQTNADVRKAGVNPLIHYLKFGGTEGRNPSKVFDGNKYFEAYPDVRLSNQNPLVHFLKWGKSHGNSSFSVVDWIEPPQTQLAEEEAFDIDQYLSYLEEHAPVIVDSRLADRKKISVVVTAYNHENYIQQCLESILMQKGNFDMEIIVGDDCSTDSTKTILEGYQEKFPQLLRILPNTANLGITKNLKRCLDACSGDYIAICEGDDYWIDKYKLQKQMDRLEKDPELSMCFSSILLYFEDNNRFVPHDKDKKVNKDKITTEDLIQYNYIGNFSCCMYRSSTIRKLPEGIFDLYAVDWMINMACGEIGSIGHLTEYMSVYRLHKAGTWTSRTQVEKLSELSTMIDVYDNFLNLRHHSDFSIYKDNIDTEIARLEKGILPTRNE